MNSPIENITFCEDDEPANLLSLPLPGQADPAVRVEGGAKIIDIAHLIKRTPKPFDYLVEGFLPAKGLADLYGPPGEGKTTLITSLAAAIGGKSSTWQGMPCKSGKVVLLGGERVSEDVLLSDFLRDPGSKDYEPGSIMAISNPDGRNAIWKWDKQFDCWNLTQWGIRVTESLKVIHPVLVVLDTTMSVAEGMNPVDVGQQYALGETMVAWARMLDTLAITISHTNQSSANEEVDRRLHYLSRSGSNGFPGAVRWIAGLTRLRATDKLAEMLGLHESSSTKKNAKDHWLIAVGASKHNEMSRPAWNNDYCAIFELRNDGGIGLVMTGQEVRMKLTGGRAKVAQTGEQAKVVKLGNKNVEVVDACSF